MIGITEAGFKATQMNTLINVKTAEKRLQFGPTKCKTMLIGKDTTNVLNSELFVDCWKVEHGEVSEPGGEDLIEIYEGPIPIEKTEQQKYLGFVLSCSGNNMTNINAMKTKSIGVIRSILNKLNSLNLQKYYFECALIFMNAILRSTILYASETYYNLKETEVRQIERIEEGFMRQVLKTTKGCPISQMYFEFGQTPARFEIIKLRLLFLKYILNQDPNSMLFKFLELQFNQSTKGDWASACLGDMKVLNICLSLDELRSMTKSKFKNIIRQDTRNSSELSE